MASGLTRPVALAHPGDGSGRLFIVQQGGEILVHDGGSVLPTPFVDLSAEVVCCGERGLLGLAFHPDYATNGTFFVNYTREEAATGQLQTVISRFQVSGADPDVADPASEEILLVVDQPASNHNAGHLAFGPDGLLYAASGDGGGGGDPFENAQALDTLLGKLLRLDVDATDPGLPYAVPPTNPFVGQTGVREEIWAYGLRNPWRFSFDRRTGDLWIGDVGQNLFEEIDLQPAASSGGLNYGWDCREGLHPFDDPNGDRNADCPAGGFTDPVLEYFQESGRCSVTGGYRYRGAQLPRLDGVYLYADFCTGEILGTIPRCDGVVESRVLLDTPFLISAFGEDEAGELYVADLNGAVHQLFLAAGSDGPDVVPAPTALDLGSVEVGDTVEAELALTNTNTGPASALVEMAVAAAGELALDREGGASPCRSLQPCLVPGASCTVSVRLQPASEGPVDGEVRLTGNFLDEVVPVTAEAVACTSAVNLDLSGEVLSTRETFRSCDTLSAGPGVTVTATGDITFRAGTRIVLESGFRVESGGRFRAEVF